MDRCWRVAAPFCGLLPLAGSVSSRFPILMFPPELRPAFHDLMLYRMADIGYRRGVFSGIDLSDKFRFERPGHHE